MGITTETGGTRFKGEYESLDEACAALTQLMDEYPNGFFSMTDEGRHPHRKFRFTYFPGDVDAALRPA